MTESYEFRRTGVFRRVTASALVIVAGAVLSMPACVERVLPEGGSPDNSREREVPVGDGPGGEGARGEDAAGAGGHAGALSAGGGEPSAAGGSDSSGEPSENCVVRTGTFSVELTGTVRDFHESHPDFEIENIVSELGLVADELGPDRKPVFAGVASETVSAPETFDQWYRDVPDVNLAIPIKLELELTDGIASVNHDSYFPIDDAGFGAEGNAHNFHFTTELHAEFTYRGGETFTFTGDDDVWVFVNRRLVIDLGGVHPEISATFELDALAEQLGLSTGETYVMDLFHAERHRDASHFNIETSLEFTECAP